MNTLAETTDADLLLWIAEQETDNKLPVLDIRRPCLSCGGGGLAYAGFSAGSNEPSYAGCQSCGGKECRLSATLVRAKKRQGRGWNPDPNPMRLLQAAGGAGWRLCVGVDYDIVGRPPYLADAVIKGQPATCAWAMTPYRALLVVVVRALRWKEAPC